MTRTKPSPATTLLALILWLGGPALREAVGSRPATHVQHTVGFCQIQIVCSILPVHSDATGLHDHDVRNACLIMASSRYVVCDIVPAGSLACSIPRFAYALLHKMQY